MNIEELNYWNDPRTRSAMTGRAYSFTQPTSSTVEIQLQDEILEDLIEAEILPDDHTGTFTFSLPGGIAYKVCGLCSGSAVVVDPNIDCCGITQEEFDEDPDFEDGYHSGRYNITCPECKGLRVVLGEPRFADERIMKHIRAWQQSEYEYVELCAAERAMGC